MKIKRKINYHYPEAYGTITVELTAEELREAYYEQEKKFRIMDIQSKFNVPNDKVDEVFNRVEDALESNDNYWETFWLTIDYVCKSMGYEEKEGE